MKLLDSCQIFEHNGGLNERSLSKSMSRKSWYDCRYQEHNILEKEKWVGVGDL